MNQMTRIGDDRIPLRSAKELRIWLQTAIRTQPTGTSLPSEKELARTFTVSRSTVQRLFASLRADPFYGGRFQRVPGLGTRVVSPEETGALGILSSTAPALTSSAERLVEYVAGRIAAGELKSDQWLPQVKWTANTFQVAHRTVRTAYGLLEAQGLVRRAGRRYRVGRQTPLERPGGRNTVRFVLWEKAGKSTLFSDRFLGRSLQRAEEEIAARGWRMLPLAREDFPEFCRRLGRVQDPPAGIILYHLRSQAETLAAIRDLESATQRIHRSGSRPPAVLLAGLTSATGGLTGLPKGFHVFNSGNIATVHMRICAQRIADGGMQRVEMFLTPSEGYDFPRYIKLAVELWRLGLERPIRLRLTTDFGPAAARAEGREIFKRCLGKVDFILRKHSQGDKQRITQLLDALFTDVADDELSDTNEVCQATDKPVVWVFAKSATLFQFLSSQKITPGNATKPNRGPWLIVLDREIALLDHGVSCCTPDWDAIGYAMAQALIGDVPVERSKKGFLRSKALFLDRRERDILRNA